MGISGHSWLMPHADRRYVGQRQVGLSPDASSLDLSSEPSKKGMTEQEALGFRLRLRIPKHAEAVVLRLTRTTTSRPLCSVPVSTRSTRSRRLWLLVATAVPCPFRFSSSGPNSL